MTRFPANDIISLVGEVPRYDLAESVGPDMRLAELLDASAQASLGEMLLGYGTAQGDPRLRRMIAGLHGVDPTMSSSPWAECTRYFSSRSRSARAAMKR